MVAQSDLRAHDDAAGGFSIEKGPLLESLIRSATIAMIARVAIRWRARHAGNIGESSPVFDLVGISLSSAAGVF